MVNLTKLSEYTSYIRSTIHDDTASFYMIENDPVIEAYVRIAANEFSKLWPRRNSVDIPAVSQQYDYALTLLTNWINGFSWIKSLEYPAGQQSPCYYKQDRFIIYNQTHLRFLDGTPADNSTIRIIYYSTHVITASVMTIPERFEYSVANFAATLALENLAAKYAKAQGADIQADVISYGTKSDNYRRLANALKKSAIDEWGEGDPESLTPPAVWNWYDGSYGDYTDYRET